MILVTGATGLVGRPLVERLCEAGIPVRAVTRDPENAGLPREVELAAGDPSWPDTLAQALEGADAVFLNPRAIGTHADELLALVRKSGVRRVVAISALNVDFELSRQPSRLTGEYNKEVEAAARASGLEWVSLRPGTYMANSIGMWAGQLRRGDVVRGAYAAASWAPIHEEDLAEVGVRALCSGELLGTSPVLTGPRSLTQQEMVAAIGAATGRALRFEEVGADAVEAAMARAGMPARMAAGFLAMQAESYGQERLVTGEVERILGRPGLTFAEWAVDHVMAFQG
ncbi:SDR family oxidoreductase [Amycolatopsis sp.]|uniref:SDR family oxidoreductase n=1 Tax=Amycolatopsis sp. TaxID=37632 RepID=UPI002CFB93BE|nr:NAD(P)H-binding protein [Amycolatopsis sp.]HVV14597.1 NAD(P)H-binding protein [Amycolatopsis sp.]